MKLNDDRVYEAIAEGVERAMWRMITNATQMPCADFFDAIKEAAREAFGNVTVDVHGAADTIARPPVID